MKSKLPIAVLSSSFLCLNHPALAGEYVVRKGDIFTKIVERFSKKSDELSYSQALALFLKLNNKTALSEFNNLKIGMKIQVPEIEDKKDYLEYYSQKYPSYWNPSSWRIDSDNKYVVKPGDSLSKIGKKYFPGMPLLGEYGSVSLLKIKNSPIKDINKIYAGQELALPSKEEIIAFIEEGKSDRYPASDDNVEPSFDENLKIYDDCKAKPDSYDVPLIDNNCQTRIQKKCFRLLNRELLESRERVDTLESLRNLLEFSKECDLLELEGFYRSALKTFMKKDNDVVFYSMLKEYFSKNFKRPHVS